MKTICIACTAVLLAGCGVELLTTTATVGQLQAQNMKAMQGNVARIGDSTAKTNLQQALQTYMAEKGHYPATLDELVPAYLPSLPTHANGTPFGYEPSSGRVVDAPVAAFPPSKGPTPGDVRKMEEIRAAINKYGMAVGYYPPSLQALTPSYIAAVPKTDSGLDFVFYPQNGGLFHPDQVAIPASVPGSAEQRAAVTPPPAPAAPQAAAPASRPVAVSGAGPMGEAMTGIAISNQLDSNSNAGSSSAGTYMRGKVGNSGDARTQQQNRVMDNLGL